MISEAAPRTGLEPVSSARQAPRDPVASRGWCRGRDSNPQRSVSETDASTSCATSAVEDRHSSRRPCSSSLIGVKESNLQPPGSEPGALPIELTPSAGSSLGILGCQRPLPRRPLDADRVANATAARPYTFPRLRRRSAVGPSLRGSRGWDRTSDGVAPGALTVHCPAARRPVNIWCGDYITNLRKIKRPGTLSRPGPSSGLYYLLGEVRRVGGLVHGSRSRRPSTDRDTCWYSPGAASR
jgi:hypothetical protein